MMDNLLDYIKSSKDLLNQCLELCSSLESNMLSSDLTDESKKQNLSKMNKNFEELKSNLSSAELISIKRNDSFRNHITTDSNAESIDCLLSKNSSEKADHNDSQDNLVSVDDSKTLKTKNDSYLKTNVKNIYVAKDCSVVLKDVSIPAELLYDSDETTCDNDIDNSEVAVLSDISNREESDLQMIANESEQTTTNNNMVSNENFDIIRDSVPDCNSIENVSEKIIDVVPDSKSICDTTKDMFQIKECKVILEDFVKLKRQVHSKKDFFEDLEDEVNKLSKIPTFNGNKKSRKNDKDGKKRHNRAIDNNKLSNKKENGSESSSGDDESVSDIEGHTSDLDNDQMVDSPHNSVDADSESSSDDDKSSDKHSNAASKANSKANSKTKSIKSISSENTTKRPLTRSLRLCLLSDLSEKSKKKSTTSNTVVCLSSSSDNDSDASSTEVQNMSKKRKKTVPSTNASKKPKIDSENENKDKSSEVETRKNIHKIFTQSKLSMTTITAEQLEMDRRKRMEEKQEMYNKSLIVASDNVSSLVLEKDQDGRSIVQVHEHIAQKLKIHQIEAINFMYDCVIESAACLQRSQENNHSDNKTDSAVGGCILAHCMGLGKTLSLIGFIHTMLTTPILNLDSCIVVCPVNTALNWKKEFEMWVPADRPIKVFEVCTHETKKNKISIVQRWQSKGGILIIGYEMFRLLATGDTKTVKNKLVRQKIFEALVDPGADFIVCDEGHLLKNEKSAITKVINQVKTNRRIVLTGTPLQNRLLEYYTMANFVKPNLLGTQKEFMNRFVNPINNGQHINSTPYDVNIMKKRSHILFKTLDGCVHRRDYSALVKYLPPKYEYVIKIRMSEIQRQLYEQYLSTIRLGGKASLFKDEMTFSRIWTHPYVLCMHQEIQDKKMFLADSDHDSFINEESDAGARQKKTKKPLKDNNNIISLVSDESNGEGDDNKMEIDDSSVDEVIRIRNTTTRTKMKNLLDDSENEECQADMVKEQIAEKHWWSDIIQPDHEHKIEISGKLTILFQIVRKAGEEGDKVIVFSHSLLVLDLIEKYMHQQQIISEKINHELNKLNDSMPDNTKSGDFLISSGCNSWIKGQDYDRMDGSTQLSTRADIQAKFNSTKNKRMRLFLISTKAGGIGVNLVSANRVVIFDVSWNPSHDIQAIFRAYRFGQVKPVSVYRLVSQGTMEEKMYERQVTKLSLSLRVVDEQQISRYFTEQDLRTLYKFEPDIYDPDRQKETPLLPKDRLLAELIQEFPQWLYGYHEHDSLLQNKAEEELTEAERQEAWKELEEEKKNGGRQLHTMIDPSTLAGHSNSGPLSFNLIQFQQIQMTQMQQHYPQYVGVYSQNYNNLLRFALTQQPELKSNPKQLAIRMQAIFFQSLQKYKDANGNVVVNGVSNHV